MPWPGFEPGCLAALPPQDSVSTSFTTRADQTSCGPLVGQLTYCARGSPRLSTAYHREPPPPQDSVSTSFTTRADQTSGGQLGGQQSYCARGSPRLTTAYHRE